MRTERRQASIATRLILLLVPLATVVLALFGAFDYVTTARMERGRLDSEATLLDDQLAVSLQLPVWNFDHDQIIAVMRSVMENPEVEAIVVRLLDARSTLHVLVRGPQETIVAGVEAPPAAGLLTRERPIMSQGEVVGRVTVFITPRFVEQLLRDGLLFSVATISVLDVVIVLAVLILLWQLVLRPLRRVELYTVAVSTGKRTDAAMGGALFRGEIERLRRAVERMVGMLDERYTALRASESELARSEERYRQVFETTSDGIFVVDVTADGRFRLAAFNPALERMVGVSGKNAVGRHVEELLPADLAAVVNADIGSCVAANGLVSFERDLTLPSGRKNFWSTMIPVSGGGAMHRVIGVVRDVTEKTIAEQRAREQETQLYQAAKLASLGTLVSGIAHEINNPNNFIRLNTQNLMEFWSDGRIVLDQLAARERSLEVRGIRWDQVRGMVDELLTGIEEGSKRIEKLLLNLRDYARGDEGDLSASVNVNDVIASAVMIMRNVIAKATKSFAVRETRPLPPVRGNYQQIEQVVINLVTNACQSLRSPEEAVTVATLVTADGATVLLEVRDEGAGIPEGNLSRVTDPFFTTKRASGGSGLGLAVSSRIVQKHGGTMEFRSTVGKGTVVEVRFPVSGRD